MKVGPSRYFTQLWYSPSVVYGNRQYSQHCEFLLICLDSFPTLSFSHVCTDQYLVEYLRGSPLQIPGFFSMQCSPFCPLGCSWLGLWTLSYTCSTRKFARVHWISPPCTTTWKPPQGYKREQSWCSPQSHCSESLLFIAWCPVIQNRSFTYLVFLCFLFGCFRWEGKSSSC